MKTLVFIVSAGPGASDLISLKGHRLIEQADLIFASERFISKEMLAHIKEGCRIKDHFESDYDEKIKMIEDTIQ